MAEAEKKDNWYMKAIRWQKWALILTPSSTVKTFKPLANALEGNVPKWWSAI